MAWVYRQYTKDHNLYILQHEARRYKRICGLTNPLFRLGTGENLHGTRPFIYFLYFHMPDISEFHHYTLLLDKLIQIADKEELAECAKLLAMNLAHYEMRYGALPLEEQLAVTSKLNEHHADLVAMSTETMVGVLGSVLQGLDDHLM